MTKADKDSTTEAEGPGYAEALAELEAILADLDGDQIDVDLLGAQVGRAATLIKICRTRIDTARADVELIVSDLEPGSTSAD